MQTSMTALTFTNAGKRDGISGIVHGLACITLCITPNLKYSFGQSRNKKKIFFKNNYKS